MLGCFIAEENFKGSIETFSNNFYGNGQVYAASGFSLVTEKIKPGYFYFKNNKLESRQKYQLSKLAKHFNLDPVYVETLGEWGIMQEQGYDRFWTAGNLRWVKTV